MSGQRGRVPSQSPPRAAAWIGLDAAVCRRERPREAFVHAGQVTALDLEHLVAVSLEQAAHLSRVLAPQHRRPGDLVAVEVQDRQHGAVARRVEEGDPLPRPLERPGLGLAVADDGEREQVGVVHHRTEGVHEHVAELTTLVDRAGRRDGDVARDAAGRGELAEEPLDARLVEGHVGIDLAVGPLEVSGGDERRAAVSGAGEVDRLLTGVPDDPRQVRVDEGQAWARAPVPEQPGLDVVGGEGPTEEGVVLQIDLTDRQVVVGPPPGVHGGDLGRRRGGDDGNHGDGGPCSRAHLG